MTDSQALRSVRRRRLATYWRRQTGMVGAAVEFGMWCTMLTAVMMALAFVLGLIAALLERLT